MDRIFLLRGNIMHYDWGGYQFIPSILGKKNRDNKPFAEYWLGAHPLHSSYLNIDNNERPLYSLINENKEHFLGSKIAFRFGRLPFLLKILDVREMLSIQVHPNSEQAENRYQIENEKAIPHNAPHRNYKDDQHKPELMVALSDFWLLHGFKPIPQLTAELIRIKELYFLTDTLNNYGLAGLYKAVMTMSQHEVDTVIAPLADRILPLYNDRKLEKNDESYWAAKSISKNRNNKSFDRGIFSIYFFNLLHLEKGEGVYQKPQLPHAYLEGQNIELMANSDNVLRAGLTSKHVDINEVLQITKYEPTSPEIINLTYSHPFSPVPEFSLEKIKVQTGSDKRIAESPEILLAMEGEVDVENDGKRIHMRRGESVFVLPATSYSIRSEMKSIVYRAFVPKV